MYSGDSERETTAHFLLRCQNHVINTLKLLKNVYNLDQTLKNYDNDHIIHTLVYGSEKFDFNLNKDTKRFGNSYFKWDIYIYIYIYTVYLYSFFIYYYCY